MAARLEGSGRTARGGILALSDLCSAPAGGDLGGKSDFSLYGPLLFGKAASGLMINRSGCGFLSFGQ